jgi:hypothetical protein
MRRNNDTLTSTVRGGMAVLAAGSLIALAGCDDHVVVDRYGCDEAHAPVGLYSVTGDEEVTIFWIPVAEEDVDVFVVYRSSSPDGVFTEIGHSRRDFFVDRNVVNGRTYFYAVAAVDRCGYESDLSYELAFDTPRPEGFDEFLYDANGDNWRRSAWDFDAYRNVPWDVTDADVFFLWSDGVPYLVCADEYTDIQDAGFAGFDDVSWAPTEGWSPTGTVEVVPGHVYVVWTWNNHFAKVRVRQVQGGYIVFDWAYQIDGGNQELSPRIPMRPLSPTVSPASRSLAASTDDADLMNARISAGRE